MNKKGFTLIELLAIIVILAIIAVITVPIILNIIDEARKGAEKNSVIGYGKAVELAYTQYQYEQSLGSGTNSHAGASTDDRTTGKVIKIGTDLYLKVDFDGDKVVCTDAENVIVDGKIYLTGCNVNTGTTAYNYGNGKACTGTDTSCDAPSGN